MVLPILILQMAGARLAADLLARGVGWVGSGSGGTSSRSPGGTSNTAALVQTGTVGGASLGTTFGAGSGQQTYHTQQKPSQMPTTHMPTVAPPSGASTAPRPTGLRRV